VSAVFAADACGRASKSEPMPLLNVVVGVDLAIGHLAPLLFATWWAERHADHQVVAAHVLPKSVIDQIALLDANFGPEQARESLVVAVDGVNPPPDECVVVRARSVEDGLLEVCAEGRAELLVLGRRALEMGPSWLRLGPVSRHFVHRLPTNVAVVPRDWKRPTKAGPVLVMVGLDDASAAAMRAAASHARALGVELLIAHAIDDPERELRPYFPPSAIEQLRAERCALDVVQLEQWLAAHPTFGEARTICKLGSPRTLAAELVVHERPSVVVVGSRRLTLRDRWFGSSTSTDLAAHLEAPVLIVGS
jgi:nucleotide-binding universal stress UspA family protein